MKVPKDPIAAVQGMVYEAQKRATSIKVAPYESSHEGLNRDSAINVAKALAAESAKDKKPFVFFSASDTIIPLLVKYSQMKR